MTIEQFRAAIEVAERADLLRRCPHWNLGLPSVIVKERKKYILIDVRHLESHSGKYMIDRETGIVYGIRGYGKVNKRRAYGLVEVE